MTQEERDRWNKLQERRMARTATGLRTKVDLARAIKSSAVGADDLVAAMRTFNEEELAGLMVSGEKEIVRARQKLAAAQAVAASSPDEDADVNF